MRILLATLLAAVSLGCAAAPYSVRLGSERITLDAPAGFSDTTDIGSPRLQDLAESLTPASNRILLFALTDEDRRRFTYGDPTELRRYVIAATPKNLERERVDARQLEALAKDSLHDLGAPAGTGGAMALLDRQPVGRAVLLAELRREASVVSVLQATRLPPIPAASAWDDPKQQYLAFTSTLLVLRGKALQLGVYSRLREPADLDWLKLTTERWIDLLGRLNR